MVLIRQGSGWKELKTPIFLINYNQTTLPESVQKTDSKESPVITLTKGNAEIILGLTPATRKLGDPKKGERRGCYKLSGDQPGGTCPQHQSSAHSPVILPLTS